MPRSIPTHLALRFGRLVKRLRNARGLTQEGLAERCDLSRDTVTRMEIGTFSPSLETLAKLVAGLDTISQCCSPRSTAATTQPPREILAMARRMSGVELALAERCCGSSMPGCRRPARSSDA